MPQLAPTRTDPTDERAAAFLALVGALLGAADFQALGAIVAYWDGDPADALPPPDDRYWARLTPSPGAADHVAGVGRGVTKLSTPMLVDVELSVPSRRLADSTAAWRAVERAFYPADPDERAAVEAFLHRYWIVEVCVEAPGWSAPSAGSPAVYARGRLRVEMTIPA